MVSQAVALETPMSKPPTIHLHSQPPALLLAIYPITLIVGSVYSRISPTANPPSPSSISSQTSEPVNYFARKGNVFNVYFVKIGWLWMSLAFLSLLLTQQAFISKRISADCRLRRVGQALFRYSIVTFSWILTTQWCFGPPIIDRGFLATGGRCELIQQKGLLEDPSRPGLNPALVLSSVSCKASGGTWEGGHDVSGHAFMLVLASAFLIFEILGSKLSTIISNNGKSVGEGTQGTMETQAGKGGSNDISPFLAELSQNFVWTIVGLSLWMLLMTGIWFHTWLEKVSPSAAFVYKLLLSAT
ncbi:putative ATP adenylyltransferase [Microsporum canis]